ncbi:MAG TPA: DUF3943 domain-containing protein, partial [Polyangiaceae bacterium]|nr:DUF3943 domain-containing protein [Polyangiaceae bacterium]
SPESREWTPAQTEQLAPHHARSFLEMGVGLGLGTGGYWLLMNRNVADWDNPRPLSRFDGSAWVLDNNSIGVNFLGHPLTGGLSYSFARANHQSVAGAFAYSFLTSFVWEFLIEFKEKVSVNDVIVTPGAGLPIGEFFYKLGLYLDSGHHDSAGMDAVRAVLGGGVALDRKLDGRAAPDVHHRDSLGFSSAIWHDFEVRYGVSEIRSAGESSYARAHASIAAKLVTLPRYGAPVRFGRFFHGAELSSFAVDVEGSAHGWGLAVAADTTLLGYHAQDFEASRGALRGQSFTVGSSVGYDYFRSTANRYGSVERAVSLPKPRLSYDVPNRREQYAALQLPGISAKFRVLRRQFRLEGSARLQPSFAGLGAPAFYLWAAQHLDERSKHILHRQGYFYGWGGAANASLRAALGPARVGFELLYGAYQSQDGLDRHPEQVTDDVHASGDVLSYRASLGVAPTANCVIALDVGARRFHSSVGGFSVTARAVERGLSASWSF